LRKGKKTETLDEALSVKEKRGQENVVHELTEKAAYDFAGREEGAS